jgi:hypothetical protein
MMAGVQQPGMTGQVKEDFINRFFELGIRIENGQLKIKSDMLNMNEFIEPNSENEFPHLKFTYCSILFVYQIDGKKGFDFNHFDGKTELSKEYFLNQTQSRAVSNCAHGLNLAGETMLGYYHSLAFNNILRNNTFINCNKFGDQTSKESAGVVSFVSYNWGRDDVPLQYNKVFENNTVLGGGRVLFQRQRNLISTNNTFLPDVKIMVDDVQLK